MNSNNLFKYIFAVVVIFLIGYTVYVIAQNKSDTSDVSLDQTSTISNIQTDLRFAIADMDTINPIISNNRNVQEITKIIYDPLVTLNENYKLEYCLAEEIAKTDDVTYIIKLRKGVLWEDRSNFTADDVEFTIDLIKNSNNIYSENLKYVYDLQIVDSTTIKIILSQPVQFFEYNLTFPIMCKQYYENEDFFASSKTPIGTGMFKISEVSTNMIKLVPNEYYWNSNKTPMATQININLYSNIGEVYTAFKNGEIDALSVKINDVETYVGTLGYNKIEYKSRDYDFVALNTASDILSDTAVRKALSLVIDRNNIAANLGSGYVSSNFSLDMGFWLYTKDLNIQTNTDEAQQILIADGWEYTSNSWHKKIDGRTKKLEFTLAVSSSNSARVTAAENIKEQLANFGIPVTISYLSDDGYQNAINNKSYEAIITGIRVGYSPSLTTFFGDNNLANYQNEEVSEIMKSISNTSDENTLYQNYNRLYDIYLEEVPYIGLYRNTDIILCNQNLVSNMTANSFNMYHNIEKWYRQ
jgi:peptide/nickel transport system substrate-binding protein